MFVRDFSILTRILVFILEDSASGVNRLLGSGCGLEDGLTRLVDGCLGCGVGGSSSTNPFSFFLWYS